MLANWSLSNNVNDMNELKISLKTKESYFDTEAHVDKVFTVGCFDLFHYGHVQLLERMASLGKQVIVGVHDSRR